MKALLIGAGYLLSYASTIYVFVLLARVLLDWLRLLMPRWMPPSWALAIFDWVYRLTGPPVRWLRRYIPPVRLGTVALDVGFMVLFLAVIFVGRIGSWLLYLGYSGA